MLYTDSHGVSALRRVTQSEKIQQILRHDTPGESQLGLELLSDAMEQATTAPHFRSYDQALLLAESCLLYTSCPTAAMYKVWRIPGRELRTMAA